MDGRTAAKEIRKLEKRTPQPKNITPLRIDDRIPIFAVSASLYESDRTNMAEHFDGWLLKPLGAFLSASASVKLTSDFNRVRAILAALEDPIQRSKEVYVQGQWERGGYLQGECGECVSRSRHGS
jgi:CheY-like chemotaxis protein